MRTKLTTALAFVAVALTTVLGMPSAHAEDYYLSKNFGGALDAYTYSPGRFSVFNSSYRAVFQTDGNFVVYYTNATPARALWSSGTANKGANRLILQKDCNMVIYNRNNGVLWTSRTGRTCGQYYGILDMQTDGNLVQYRIASDGNPVAVWASNTVFH